jgi:hypothetical protein
VEADSRLVGHIDELIRHFNQRSLDLPDGLFTRQTQLRLNDVPFEAMLGRSPDDPLVLLLARGPAGYRFAAKAVQHAVPDATLERGEIEASDADGRVIVRTSCWLSGHYRGTGEAANDVFDVSLNVGTGGAVETAAVTLDATAVARLRDARLRP